MIHRMCSLQPDDHHITRQTNDMKKAVILMFLLVKTNITTSVAEAVEVMITIVSYQQHNTSIAFLEKHVCPCI